MSAIAFKATQYESDGAAYVVMRSGKMLGRWVALVWAGGKYEVIADECLTAEEAQDACRLDAASFALAPANDVGF